MNPPAIPTRDDDRRVPASAVQAETLRLSSDRERVSGLRAHWDTCPKA